MRRRFETLRKDPRASISWTLDEGVNNLLCFLSTALAKLKAWLWGVELGSSTRFFGGMEFKKYPRSEIRIGEQCTFRSRFRSNLVGINHPCAITTHRREARISIGRHCGFSGVVIAAKESIRLGNDVLCGANTVITDFDWHGVDPAHRRDDDAILSAPVVIGDNVWLGMNVVVLKGVTIGENSVIAAQSVVTGSIPANVLAGGIPAKVIRSL